MNLDGTISLLRAGIDRIGGPALPIPLQATLVARVQGEIGDQGPHMVELRCMNQDGATVLPRIQGNIDIPQGGGAANLVFRLDVEFKEAGRLTWYLRIDQQIADELPMIVEVISPKK